MMGEPSLGCSARVLTGCGSSAAAPFYFLFFPSQINLHAVIQAGILEEVHKRYVLYQILRALKYMHSGELLHRDMVRAHPAMPSAFAHTHTAYRGRGPEPQGIVPLAAPLVRSHTRTLSAGQRDGALVL